MHAFDKIEPDLWEFNCNLVDFLIIQP